MNIVKLGKDFVDMDRVLYVEDLGVGYDIVFDVAGSFGALTRLRINESAGIAELTQWLLQQTPAKDGGQ